jgi:hypothetical protein
LEDRPDQAQSNGKNRQSTRQFAQARAQTACHRATKSIGTVSQLCHVLSGGAEHRGDVACRSEGQQPGQSHRKHGSKQIDCATQQRETAGQQRKHRRRDLGTKAEKVAQRGQQLRNGLTELGGCRARCR